MNAEKNIEKVFSVLEKIAGTIILLLAVLTVVNVIMRRLFNLPIFGVTEIVEYGTLLAMCLAAGNSSFKRVHPSVNILVDRLKKRTRYIVSAFVDGICALVMSYTGIGLIPNALTSISESRVTESLGIPYSIVYGLIIICVLAVAVAYLLLVFFDIRAFAKKEPNLNLIEKNGADINIDSTLGDKHKTN
ncbi:TRAP transporter small permease [Adlercreutzia sp. ZJ304]|uniref:TRAP transporter small permease n=1 Tax=Adlercreutzia sp. ZJ304 TaxID=2709791 RepID=UPI0013ED51F5|nr:TRAP transporter small permease [Adlercreutzia sp. ZJ304]